MRKNKGITLIALIITIIVLLILAGVALATLTGQGNIIGNAENAVGKYNNESCIEQKTLNQIEKFFAEKLDRNEPIVKSKQESVTITVGESYETSSYFEIEQNGSSPIKSIEYNVDNTSSLGEGTHTVICTVTKENGKSTILQKTSNYLHSSNNLCISG